MVGATMLPPSVHAPGSRRPQLDVFQPESARDGRDEAFRHDCRDPDGFDLSREPPFSLSTDPEFFYHSATHDDVAQQLLTAIRRRNGIALVTGESGTGKTVLCRFVAEELDRRTLCSMIFSPIESVEDLIQTILVDFGITSRRDLARALHDGTHDDDAMSTLRAFLASLDSLDVTAVVVVDQAHRLTIDVMKGLPAVADAGRSLQVILVGQPALNATLKRSDLRRLSDRIRVRARLQVLSLDEIRGYVTHRLSTTGDDASIGFTDDACARLHALSAGLPRIVNLICDRAMSLADAHGMNGQVLAVDRTLVDAAAGALNLRGALRSRPRAGLLFAAMLILLAGLGAGSATWLFRADLARVVQRWENKSALRRSPVRLPSALPVSNAAPDSKP